MGMYYWPFIGSYLIQSIIVVALISVVGLIVGRISYHEPEDDI